MEIRALQKSDFPAVQGIYQQGIETGDATFETGVKDWSLWDQNTAQAGRLVVVEEGSVLGWACLSDVASRCVYRGVAETSVYIDASARGRGLGLILLNALVEASEEAGYWTLQARIFPENAASVAIHQRAGFESMGLHKKLGKLNGIWRDVQLLERRSSIVGLD